MNKDVVTALRDHMNGIAESETLARQFNLEYWGDRLAGHGPGQETPDCGFNGCLMGWAAHAQWFAPFGLHLVLTTRHEPAPGFTVARAWTNIGLAVVAEGSEPRFHQFVPGVDQTSFDSDIRQATQAVAYLMGIRTTTLEYIIYSEHYDSDVMAADVAMRLDTLLAHDEETFVAMCRSDDFDRGYRLEEEANG
jgi:hypothetical protein